MHFYFQVQTQIFVTEADSGYFCLQTASPIDNCFVQEISCDQFLIDLCVFRASIFFKCAIVPEFFSQLLFKESIIQSILKDVIADVCDSVSRPKTVHESDCLTVVPVCLYPCGMCSTECSDDPADISEESVCCDIVALNGFIYCVLV